MKPFRKVINGYMRVNGIDIERIFLNLVGGYTQVTCWERTEVGANDKEYRKVKITIEEVK